MREIRKVHIVYFSGTGGTARVAGSLEKVLHDRKIEVCKTELTTRYDTDRSADLLVLLFPVHAFNAPKPVDEWIALSPTVKSRPAAVISVSAGGDIRPNIACRVNVIEQLEAKGYDVCYESMLVMPSNVFKAYDDKLSAMLLRALPHKAERIGNDLLSGIRKRTQAHFIDKLISRFGALEKKYGGKSFGSKLKANINCNGCSWCAKHCPRGNITMQNGRPCFGRNCVICLRCVYGCPQKAIISGIKFIILKEGYDLKAIEEHMKRKKAGPISKIPKGLASAGVRKYLKEKNERY